MKGPPNLHRVSCCATCIHYQGWLDNMFCAKYQVGTQAGFICDDFEQESQYKQENR